MPTFSKTLTWDYHTVDPKILAALAPIPCKENIRAHAHVHILVTSPNLDRIGHRTAKVRRPRVALHARSHMHAGVYRECICAKGVQNSARA